MLGVHLSIIVLLSKGETEGVQCTVTGLALLIEHRGDGWQLVRCVHFNVGRFLLLHSMERIRELILDLSSFIVSLHPVL